MRQENILILIGTIVFGGIFVYLMFFKNSKYNQIKSVQIGEKKIEVEIADTQAKMAKGLMFRKELGKDNGMLFIFPNVSKHSFWMANTYIPLDIIWLNENQEIIYISANTPSCTATGNFEALCKTYSPDQKAKFVLEVNGGWAEKNKVTVGTKVEFIW